MTLRLKMILALSATALTLAIGHVATARGEVRQKVPTQAVAASKSLPAEAPEKAAGENMPRLLGTWPDPSPRVSLDLEDESVAAALSEIAQQAGWSLAYTGADVAREVEITLKVQDRPVTEALEVVLDAAGLEAKLNGGILVVRAQKSKTANSSASIELTKDGLRVNVEDADDASGDHHPGHHGSTTSRARTIGA